MKFWKTLVTDWHWWVIMAVLFFIEAVVLMGIGLVTQPMTFTLGFWLPTPIYYYFFVYRKQQKV